MTWRRRQQRWRISDRHNVVLSNPLLPGVNKKPNRLNFFSEGKDDLTRQGGCQRHLKFGKIGLGIGQTILGFPKALLSKTWFFNLLLFQNPHSKSNSSFSDDTPAWGYWSCLPSSRLPSHPDLLLLHHQYCNLLGFQEGELWRRWPNVFVIFEINEFN